MRETTERWVTPPEVFDPLHAEFLFDKFPSIRDFRQRIKDVTPPTVAGPEAATGPARCPAGHHMEPRQFRNPAGRVLGPRPWCPCEDRVAARYGATWLPMEGAGA